MNFPLFRLNMLKIAAECGYMAGESRRNQHKLACFAFTFSTMMSLLAIAMALWLPWDLWNVAYNLFLALFTLFLALVARRLGYQWERDYLDIRDQVLRDLDAETREYEAKWKNLRAKWLDEHGGQTDETI